jgi:hypothetical protein
MEPKNNIKQQGSDAKGEPMIDLETETWYWTSLPSEGDVFSPAWVQDDGLILMDDETYTVTQLAGLTFTKAVMPRDRL